MWTNVIRNVVLIVLFLVGFYFYAPLAAFAAILMFGLATSWIVHWLLHAKLLHRYSQSLVFGLPIAVLFGIVAGVFMAWIARDISRSVVSGIVGKTLFALAGLYACFNYGNRQSLDVGKIIGKMARSEEEAQVLVRQNEVRLETVSMTLGLLRNAAVYTYVLMTAAFVGISIYHRVR